MALVKNNNSSTAAITTEDLGLCLLSGRVAFKAYGYDSGAILRRLHSAITSGVCRKEDYAASNKLPLVGHGPQTRERDVGREREREKEGEKERKRERGMDGHWERERTRERQGGGAPKKREKERETEKKRIEGDYLSGEKISRTFEKARLSPLIHPLRPLLDQGQQNRPTLHNQTLHTPTGSCTALHGH